MNYNKKSQIFIKHFLVPYSFAKLDFKIQRISADLSCDRVLRLDPTCFQVEKFLSLSMDVGRIVEGNLLLILNNSKINQ